MSPNVEQEYKTQCRKCGEPTNFTINGLCMICYGLVDEQDYMNVQPDH